MSSTPEDGDIEQHTADEAPHITDLQDETLPIEEEAGHAKDVPTGFDEDIDTIPELEARAEPDPDAVGASQEDFHDAAVPQPAIQLTDASPRPASLDSASIPDDTPSVQDSGVSSPKSDAQLAPPPISRKSSTASRRPFELRFQSRLSSSYINSPRSSSPAFLNVHSRNSSLASLGPPSESAGDDSQPPWEVIRWSRLKKLTGQAFSEVGRRNFGSPTCLAVTDQIVIGTSRGLVLVFDHHQVNRTIIGPGTKAAEAGPVTALAISADYTAIAVGHATGNIFTWDLSRPTRPFLQIPAMDAMLPESRKADGHLQGSAVLHIGFLGYRRTALVSADDKGMAFSHLASRGTGAIGRTVKTTRILGRYPELIVRRTDKPIKKSSVLAFSPLPLGNVEQSTDGLGLVAMLTPYLLVIVSTTPIAQTQYKFPRPREVAAHSAMTAALAWFPAIKLKGSKEEVSKNKLVYAWSNVLSILDVAEVPKEPDAPEDKPVELQFLVRSQYKAKEAIVGVQWLSRSVLAVLTITQQLLIIEDAAMNVTDAFDLLPKNIYHADLYSHQLQAVIEHHDEEEDTSMHGVVADGYYMSFRCYKGRLFLLGFNDIWWGSLTNWADRLLAMMETGDFIGAIRLATNYFSGIGEKVTIGLPEDDGLRSSLVRDKLLEMMSASLRYAFGKNEQAMRASLDRQQLSELAVACIGACLKMDDQNFLFEEVFDWYDENQYGDIFVDAIEPHILDRQIVALPPAAIKTLINHLSRTHTPSQLEEIICLLDATTMDVDQVTGLCKQYGLYDAYIYVWNVALFDYASPLLELLKMLSDKPTTNGNSVPSRSTRQASQKMFPYLSFVLTSRIYPLGENMDEERALMAKTQIYELLFYGKGDQRDPFSTLRKILEFDAPAFMGAMNEAFEDPFLNNSQDDTIDGNVGKDSAAKGSIFNRLIIVRILLDVMSTGFDAEDRIYLDMFIARNLPKYPQYMLLKGSIMEQIFARLCQCEDVDIQDDAQLSLEYLMTAYKPANMTSFIPMLWRARFYRILKNVYRQEGDWTELLKVYFVDAEYQTQVFSVILECLRKASELDHGQRQDFATEVKAHADDLARIDACRTARVVDTVMPAEHAYFIEALESDSSAQFLYLQTLIEPQNDANRSSNITNTMLEQYVRLMCQYDPGHVVEYINTIKEGDLELDKVVPALETSGNIDAAVILLARQGQVQSAMERLIRHLAAIEAALSGVLESAADSPDEVATNEAIEDLLESVDKYAKVGIWLCESQTKEGPRIRTPSKSPRRSSVKQPLSFEENLWLEFIVAVVSIAQKVGPGPAMNESENTTEETDELSNALRQTIQRVFTTLLNTTTTRNSVSQTSSDSLRFPRILRAFLSRASEISPSLSHLRHVMSSIFSAYAYEQSLLTLSNAMLDKDLFVQVDEITKLRVQGWRPRGQVCGICRQRVWGPGTGFGIWEAWEKKEKRKEKRAKELKRASTSELFAEEESIYSRGKGKAAAIPTPGNDEDDDQDTARKPPIQPDLGPVIVFSCRHLFHRRCLDQSLEPEEETGGGGNDEGDDVGGGTGAGMKLACPLCA